MAARSGSTKAKTKEIKFRVELDVLEEIDERQINAGYATRAAYLMASALSGVETDLNTIARHIGRLGHLCNGLLSALGDDRNAAVEDDIRRTVDEISKACLLITSSLQERS
ncbi:hypothetical protein [Falsigemmobacter faecalis]|uniref:Uncharacterized protein n=1 Tax=Falsigemmobacter faecalis TaxID=2488730 RepID=A0A3P3DQN2_9RHOB|nr:hypothetical protein [Falsigemmobacter faecalis]RRH76577.1 hypothetical protein EG244_05240 [Falsigemmobacter faecalis]